MEWFRFYHEVLNDPKAQRLEGEMFKTWVNLLCLASAQTERGSLPSSLGDIAWALRIPNETLQERFTLLQQYGFIDFDTDQKCYKIHGWSNRQKLSDDVTARVQKHRSRQKEGETLQERSGNALDRTDTDKNRIDREIEPRAGARGTSTSSRTGGANGRNSKPTFKDVMGELAREAAALDEGDNIRRLPFVGPDSDKRR